LGFINIFERYKEKIKEMFLSNKDLCKLIKYNVGNPLEQLEIRNPYELFDKHILFKYKNFESIKDEDTFVMVNFMNSPISKSVLFKQTSIIFTIVTHNNIETLENGSNRAYAIADKIDEFMCGNVNIGYKPTQNKGLNPVNVGNSDFVGYNLIYTTHSRGYNYNNKN